MKKTSTNLENNYKHSYSTFVHKKESDPIRTLRTYQNNSSIVVQKLDKELWKIIAGENLIFKMDVPIKKSSEYDK